MKERRKGADLWTKVMIALNILAWFGILAVAILISFAQPEMETGAMRYKGIKARSYWHDWLPIMWPVVSATTLLTLTAILMNLKRLKRKQDQVHRNFFILVALLSVILWVMFTVS